MSNQMAAILFVGTVFLIMYVLLQLLAYMPLLVTVLVACFVGISAFRIATVLFAVPLIRAVYR